MKVYAVTWARGEYQPRFTNFVVGEDAKDARKQVLAGGIAKVIHGVVRMESLENSIPEHYYDWV